MNKVINIATKNNIKEFDALIVGGGGSGMRTSLELAKSGLNTAVISKAVSYTHLTLPTILLV